MRKFVADRATTHFVLHIVTSTPITNIQLKFDPILLKRIEYNMAIDSHVVLDTCSQTLQDSLPYTLVGSLQRIPNMEEDVLQTELNLLGHLSRI